MPQSPYPPSRDQWRSITQELINEHPLDLGVIRETAEAAWSSLWRTSVGSGKTAVRLDSLSVPATVVGYFFEVLFAAELSRRFPSDWRGGRSANEKDLVYLPDPTRYSVEMKCSGQLGYRVYGNRSYGQELQEGATGKKEKSGYYITVNFFAQTLTLLRFGWIDHGDWSPQKAPSGQMSGLNDDIYKYKLTPIPGDYQLAAPVRILRGIGDSLARKLDDLGVCTVGELLQYQGELPKRIASIRQEVREYYNA